MVGSASTLAVLGLGAVGWALPATPVVKDRQIWGIGGGNAPPPSFTWGPTVPTTTCVSDISTKDQPPCIPVVIPGQLVPDNPKEKRFWLPDGWQKDKQHAIDTIEKKIEALQNKRHKTDDDYDELNDLYDALYYLAGVTDISAPPGSTVVFHPGKKAKRFTLPEGWDHDKQHAIDTIEKKIEALQNKRHKTDEDYEELDDLYDALNYLAGVTNISAPPGSTVVFHPGKRNNVKDCTNLVGAELALEGLMHQDRLSPQEHIIAEKLKSFLFSCGITIIKSPDGTSTTIQPSNKRSNPPFDLTGVEKAYEALAQSVGTSTPSLYTYLAMEHLASILELYGIAIEKTPAGTTTTLRPGKRQITIGQGTCQLADIKGFKSALEALLNAYGPPSKAPWNVQLIEAVIIETLRYCGQDVSGWTGPIVPNPTIPGGPIVPDPTVPGGPITPDPTVPGGPITPDPTEPGGPITPDPTVPGGPINPDPSYPGSPITPDPTVPGGPITPDPTQPGAPINPSDKRQVLLSDPTALLAALKQLEDTYGHYGSNTIPLPILIIMENMVIVLQAIPGVIVPGWPTIGGGAITPSN